MGNVNEDDFLKNKYRKKTVYCL